jgi:hypothetical protein
MNEHILSTHLEMHRVIMAEVRKLVPAKQTFNGAEYSLSQVVVDEDDCLIAKYSRYMGCGDYDYETVYLRSEELCKE